MKIITICGRSTEDLDQKVNALLAENDYLSPGNLVLVNNLFYMTLCEYSQPKGESHGEERQEKGKQKKAASHAHAKADVLET